MILAIETATQICSVALFKNQNLLGLLESNEQNAHSRILHSLIDQLFKENNADISNLKAVAVSKGPGSYTGLRIGVSAAKGLCYARNIPLIAINTLQSMAFGMKMQYETSTLQKYKSHELNNPGEKQLLFIPMIDARRMEVYSAVYDADMQEVRPASAEIITEGSYSDITQDHTILIAGDGAEKCISVLGNEHFTLLEQFHASSLYMMEPVNNAWESRDFADTAYFEPFYLKDFIAGKPKVKGLDQT